MAEKKKAVVVMPYVDQDGRAVFRCLNEEDANLVASTLRNPKGVKVKSSKEKTCPFDPKKPYSKSICKKIEELFEKSQ